jgi:hypothetical protein|tara:strand:- start:10026 stop:10415 length:390 start_codon:yes stop_codon:yes gene_type:complete
MPKTKKPSRSKLVKKLDTVFSKWTRLSNADNNGNCTCVTCDKVFFWKEIQAGHFMSRKHYSIRWSEDNVKPQCAACNVFRYGEQYKYSLFLGKVAAESLYLQSKKLVKYTNYELQDLIDLYSSKLKALE